MDAHFRSSRKTATGFPYATIALAALFAAIAARAESYGEAQRASAPASEAPVFSTGRGAPPATGRGFDATTREVKKVLQYFSPAWIEAKSKPSPSASGESSLSSAMGIVKSILSSAGGFSRGAVSRPSAAATGAMPSAAAAGATGGAGPRIQVADDGIRPATGRTGPGASPGGGGGAKQDQAGIGENSGDTSSQGLPFWLPVCFLADQGASADSVNGKIKAMVDAYAKCGVVIEPFAYTIKSNYGQDPAQISEYARATCNIPDRFGIRGAIQLDVNNAQIPARMCNDPQATGCSTLCERTSVSMVGPTATPILGVHESMHSNCCGRLCVNSDEGVEPGGPGISLAHFTPVTEVKIFHAEEGANLRPADISPNACESIRTGAAQNDGSHRYVAAKQRYYAVADERAQIDITQRKNVFARPLGDADGGGEGGRAGGARIGFVDESKAPESGPVASAGGGTDARHLGKSGGATSQLLGAVRQTPADIDNMQFTSGAPGSGSPPSAPAQSIGFDDNAAKMPGGGGGTSSLSEGKGSGPSFSSKGGGGDEGGPVPPMKQVAEEGSSGGGGGGGGKIGYDDDAPKGRDPAAVGPAGPAGATGGGALGSQLIANGGPAGSSLSGEIFKRAQKVALNKKGSRQRGAALKRNGNSFARGPSAFSKPNDTIITTRGTAPDFEVDVPAGADGSLDP